MREQPLPPVFPSLLPAFTSVLACAALWMFVTMARPWIDSPRVDGLPAAPHGTVFEDGYRWITAEFSRSPSGRGTEIRAMGKTFTTGEFCEVLRQRCCSCCPNRVLIVAPADAPWASLEPVVLAAQSDGDFDRIAFATTGSLEPVIQQGRTP